MDSQGILDLLLLRLCYKTKEISKLLSAGLTLDAGGLWSRYISLKNQP
jgi:hypothetical protein